MCKNCKKERNTGLCKCPLCGFEYCVSCMPMIDGGGRCPNCYDGEA